MQVNQRLSILFYPKRKKINKQKYIPIWVRTTIDGLEDEISTSIQILDEEWDRENKEIKPENTRLKALNKKMGQIKTDLERHFDLVVAKNGLATPKLVFESYRTPINGNQQKTEKRENPSFSTDLDDVIKNYIKYNYQVERLEKNAYRPPLLIEKLEQEKECLKKEIDALVKRGRVMFDDKKWTKTFMLAIDEFLLDFLELVINGDRETNTLKKKWGTKKRLQEFMEHRYQKQDFILATMEFSFIKEFVKNEKLIYHNGDNTIWKYTQIIKEIIERTVCNGWVSNNVFSLYESKYVEPEDKTWPTPEQMLHLMKFEFETKDKELSEIRWLFIYQSFAGPSYAEMYALRDCHLNTGIDGKTWVDQKRRKTDSQETLPLLPVCLEIIEMFRNHPRCLKRGKLLPVPTDQHYNRCLKVIGERTGIPILNNCHQARYYFANEVLYANGIHNNKNISILMVQRDERSAKTYVKLNKKIISNDMEKVQETLYGPGGFLEKKQEKQNGSAKVIPIRNTISPFKVPLK